MSNNVKQASNARAYCLLLSISLGVFGLWSWLSESVIHELLLNFLREQFNVSYPDATGLALTIVLVAIGLFLRSRVSYVHEFELAYSDLVKKLKLKFFSLSFMIALFAAASYGVFTLYHAVPGNEQETLTIDLAADDLPRFIQLQRVSLRGAALSKQIGFDNASPETSSNQLRRYTPILSASQPSRPIQFVHLYTSGSIAKHKSQKANLSGFVNLRPLPASIRAGFEDNGLSFASPVYVISDSFFDVAPYLKWTAIFLGLISLILFIRLLMLPAIHKRKLQSAWDHQRGYSKNKDVSKDIWPWS